VEESEPSEMPIPSYFPPLSPNRGPLADICDAPLLLEISRDPVRRASAEPLLKHEFSVAGIASYEVVLVVALVFFFVFLF